MNSHVVGPKHDMTEGDLSLVHNDITLISLEHHMQGLSGVRVDAAHHRSVNEAEHALPLEYLLVFLPRLRHGAIAYTSGELDSRMTVFVE